MRIVLDHPRRHFGQRVWRRISTLAGGILLGVGLTASILAVPASLAIISFVIGWATTEPSDADRWPAEDVPVRDVLLAWAVATPLAVGGLRMGLRLVRRNRTLILFLRRFGYDDAQSAVTFAVLRTIGSTWRVVTLDDAEMAPIGVADAPRVLFRAGQVASKYVLTIAQFVGLRTFPFLVIAMWGIVALGLMGPALEFARTGTTTPDAWIGAIDPYLTILASVFERRLPLDFVGPTLPGVFALLAIAAALSFATLLVTMAALLLAFPLSTVLLFLSSSASSVQEAERSKSVAVSSGIGIQQAARAIALRSRKVFGPRLVVLRVESHLWQHAVSELASLSSLPLIDISETTENVLWELEELTKRLETGASSSASTIGSPLPQSPRREPSALPRFSGVLPICSEIERCWRTRRTGGAETVLAVAPRTVADAVRLMESGPGASQEVAAPGLPQHSALRRGVSRPSTRSRTTASRRATNSGRAGTSRARACSAAKFRRL